MSILTGRSLLRSVASLGIRFHSLHRRKHVSGLMEKDGEGLIIAGNHDYCGESPFVRNIVFLENLRNGHAFSSVLESYCDQVAIHSDVIKFCGQRQWVCSASSSMR